MVLLSYEMAKMGSIPPDIPIMVERVPVGAMVRSWEFLSPYWATRSAVSLEALALKNSEARICEGTHFSNIPFSLARRADSLRAVSIISLPSLSQKSTDSGEPYLYPSMMSMSARPMMPRPICLHSLTDLLCSSKGWRGRPSSRTSFSPRTQILTAWMNSSFWNLPSLTNAARFMLPRRHDPPAGRGSSAQGFVPA